MRYAAPESLEGAVALLAGAKGEARVLAGGTDLLVQMRADMVDPELIVDIKRIPETRTVTEEGGGWRIGAAVTGAELKEHPRLKQVWPGVVEAANLIGSTQVQGRATLGGNLCNGSPAADSVPALIAAGAVATLAGPKGRRNLPVEDVMLGPRKLALTKGEILVSFLLPPRAAALRRRLPALHPAHGDGHRGGRGGGKREPRRRGDHHGSAGQPGRGGGTGPARPRGRTGHHREPARPGGPGPARGGGAGGLPADRRQARYHRVPHRRGGRADPADRPDRTGSSEGALMAKHHIEATVNGDAVEFLCETEETLLDVLRDTLDLTGSKEGCSSGDCGACSVMLDGRLVCACLVLGCEVGGRQIETIEGMAKGERLHPLQQRFLEAAALQCGICTPGFLMASRALLEKTPNPTEHEVRFWLAGNLCRCTGYDKIVTAVLDTAAAMRRG